MPARSALLLAVALSATAFADDSPPPQQQYGCGGTLQGQPPPPCQNLREGDTCRLSHGYCGICRPVKGRTELYCGDQFECPAGGCSTTPDLPVLAVAAGLFFAWWSRRPR